MVFYNFAESFSNYLSYLIIFILKNVLHQNYFEFSIIIIVSLLNMLNYIMFFIYNMNLEKVYKKKLNEKKKNEKENEANENIGCCKKVFIITGKIILNFFLFVLVTISSLEPSILYKEENYGKLFFFIWLDFIIRISSENDMDSIPPAALSSFIVLLISFLYYYHFEKNYLVLTIFSLFYGNTCLTINHITNKTETRSGTFPQGNYEEISSIKVPFGADMTNITIILNNLYGKIFNNEKQNRILSQLRDTLLPRLMSGELEIQDIEESL